MRRASRSNRLANDASGRPIPCSTIDFHVHTSANGADLTNIRTDRVSRDGLCRLWGGPYVVTPLGALEGVADRSRIEAQHFERLASRVAIVRQEDDGGRRRVPSGVLH